MENFIVSARKYRPATFNTVVGQNSITITLKNAIKNNHLAHAYLFCGPRGVGKTTCARIFAKTINCAEMSSDFEACNECESCKSFNENRSYNIHELDAASNNSVEDIRNLIDQVRIPPQMGKYSVYIIDEVHMLSSQAFNAFLKTLEEPPAHAIFILATTEKHKIIPTILSRCQIFDFNRIKVDDIVGHLQFVAKSENVEADVNGLNVIAQKSEGSMRDALSVFDQIVSFSGSNITYESVIENLNVLDYDYYFKLTDAFISDDISITLVLFNEILDKGFDGHNFITGLAKHFRDLLVCKDKVTADLLEVGANIKEQYLLQSEKCSQDWIFDALEITSFADINYKASTNQRLLVELSLVKLCRINCEKKKSELKKEQSEINITEKKNDNSVKSNKKSTKSEQNIPEKTVDDDIKPVVNNISNSTKSGLSEKSFSIKAALSSQTNIDSDENNKKSSSNNSVEKDLKEDFSQEILIEVWKKFAEKFKNEKPRLHTLFLTQLPVLKNDFILKLSLKNPLQVDELNRNKPELLSFLSSHLRNTHIAIETNIEEDENIENRLYTDSDKLKHLLNKNPNIKDLRDKFSLDFQ